MKRFKINLPIIALVMAVAASAFTAKKSMPDPYTYYFRYNGSTTGGQLTPGNYAWLQGGQGSTQCGDAGPLNCVINAEKDGSDLPILQSGGSNVFVVKNTREMP